MEQVLADADINGGRLDECSLGKISSSDSSSTDADPVVYKLVRVEGDGRLVPATDDEVMEVEDLLEDDKIEPPLVKEHGHTGVLISCNRVSSKKSDLDSSEGLSKSDDMDTDSWKLNRLEYIEEMLHKVKREERQRLLCGSPDHTSRCMNTDSQSSNQQEQLMSSDQKPHAENSLQENRPVSCRLNQDNATEIASRMTCPSFTDERINCRSSVSDAAISIPDFSTIKKEVICLDKLSIRELQETFRATFGRETSVKDKLWLKRRITMGLTNSCDVSTTKFIIKGKKLVSKKGNEESLCQMDNSKSDDYSQPSGTIGVMDDNDGRVPLTVLTNKMEDQLVSLGKDSGITKSESDVKTEDLHMGQSPAKRLRKPTRRYIEELSEVESREGTGRLNSAVKNLGHGHLSQKQEVRHVQDAGSAGTIVARKECLGGCSVLVPYVSRVRKGRPRQNVLTLTNYIPSVTECKLVPKKADMCSSWQDGDDGGGSRIIEPTELSPLDMHLDAGETEKESEKVIGTCTREYPQKIEHACIDSSGDNSDDYVETVPTSKGGTRRKHHRAWTLCEVMKLVDGVSRYGAGRWSEIKRLAFASYSYRTSVDLKDKWRNLLRASLSHATPGKGVSSSRKHASMPIPMPILIRVRELAEKHSQCTSEQSFSKLVGCKNRTVSGTTSGYL